MPALIDLAGQQFGRWTVLARAERHSGPRGLTQWFCHCACGTERAVLTANLRHGHSISCGCLRRQRVQAALFKHGHCGGKGKRPSRAYTCWRNMLQRCFNPRHPHYPDYGGRGIRPCDAWLVFENYYADTGEPPPGMSLDRIDNDRGYEPGNWRWATAREQALNRRPRKGKRRRAELADILKYANPLAQAASRGELQ
jgi:hypothetical protein